MEDINQPVTPPQASEQLRSDLESSSKSKIIPFLIVVILLVLVGAGSYILGTKKSQPAVGKVVSQPTPTPTPDPTANWKTYQDDLFGFSLKYPNGLQSTYEEKSVNSAQEVNKQSINAGFISTNGISLHLDFEKNSNFVDNNSFLNFIKTGHLADVIVQEIYVDKIKAILSTPTGTRIGMDGKQNPPSSVASFFNKGKTYSISIYSPQENGSQEQLLKLILSTFKFTP